MSSQRIEPATHGFAFSLRRPVVGTPTVLPTMTADDSTPREGHESIGFDDENELESKTDRELAMLIEEEKNRLRESSEEVTKALLNEDTPLTDHMVGQMWDISMRLRAISTTLVLRVPDEHRIENE